MFERTLAKAGLATTKRAFAEGRLSCPICGQKPVEPPSDTDSLLRCEACDSDAFPSEWRVEHSADVEAQPDKIPNGTEIRRDLNGPNQTIWHIPATGKFGFFLLRRTRKSGQRGAKPSYRRLGAAKGRRSGVGGQA